MTLRFIEARFTPTGSVGGWAVPPSRFASNFKRAEADIKQLAMAGLKEGDHYRVLRHSDKRLKRVVFDSDMAFIQAKMILT